MIAFNFIAVSSLPVHPDTENKDQGLESGTVAGIVMGGLSLVFIRASVDALCRDGADLISRERVQRGRLTRQGTRS